MMKMEKKETNDTKDVKAICPRCDTEISPTDTHCDHCGKEIPTDFEGMVAALLLGHEMPSSYFEFKNGTIITEEITKELCRGEQKRIYMVYQEISQSDPKMPHISDCENLKCPVIPPLGQEIGCSGGRIGKTLVWSSPDWASEIVFCEVCKWGIDKPTVVETDEGRMSLGEIFERRQSKLMLGAKVALDIFHGDNIVIKEGEVVTNELIDLAKEHSLFTELSMSLKFDE